MSRFCYECLSEIGDLAASCPYCGKLVSGIAADPRDLPPGTILKGRYMIGRSIGHGGFGVTYKAIELSVHIKVCVKEYNLDGKSYRNPARPEELLPLPEYVEEFEEHKESFQSEGTNLAKLSDTPNVVRCMETFAENNTQYLVMELLEGRNLLSYVTGKGGGVPHTLSKQEAALYMCEILKALSGVHRLGMLHRDISPDNIYLLDNEMLEFSRYQIHRIKLIDFGSARRTDQNEKTGFVKGVYTAPEVKIHDTEGDFTDIYAAGLVLYFMLMGRAAHHPKAGEEIAPPDAAHTDAALTAIFRKATHRNPKERYQKADAMLADLEKYLGERPRKKNNTKIKVLAAALGTVTLSLIGLVIFAVTLPESDNRPVTTPRAVQSDAPGPLALPPMVNGDAAQDPYAALLNTASLQPTDVPTPVPPTDTPTPTPTDTPTPPPTDTPTPTPMDTPTPTPTDTPTPTPTDTPTPTPTDTPTPPPTDTPAPVHQLINSFRKQYIFFPDHIYSENLQFADEAYIPEIKVMNDQVVSMNAFMDGELYFDTNRKQPGTTDVYIDGDRISVKVVPMPRLNSERIGAGNTLTVEEGANLDIPIVDTDSGYRLVARSENGSVKPAIVGNGNKLHLAAQTAGKDRITVYAEGVSSSLQDEDGRIPLFSVDVTVAQRRAVTNRFAERYCMVAGETLEIPLSFYKNNAFVPQIEANGVNASVENGSLVIRSTWSGSGLVRVVSGSEDGSLVFKTNELRVDVMERPRLQPETRPLSATEEETLTVSLSPLPADGKLTAELIPDNGKAQALTIGRNGSIRIPPQQAGQYQLHVSLTQIDTPIEDLIRVPLTVTAVERVEASSFRQGGYTVLRGEALRLPLKFRHDAAFAPQVQADGGVNAAFDGAKNELIVTGQSAGKATVRVGDVSVPVTVLERPSFDASAEVTKTGENEYAAEAALNGPVCLRLIHADEHTVVTVTDPKGSSTRLSPDALEAFVPNAEGDHVLRIGVEGIDTPVQTLCTVRLTARSALENTFRPRYTLFFDGNAAGIPLRYSGGGFPLSVEAENMTSKLENGFLYLQPDLSKAADDKCSGTVRVSDWRNTYSFDVQWDVCGGIDVRKNGESADASHTVNVLTGDTVTVEALFQNSAVVPYWLWSSEVPGVTIDGQRVEWIPTENGNLGLTAYYVPDPSAYGTIYEGTVLREDTEIPFASVVFRVEDAWLMDGTHVSTGNDDPQTCVENTVRALIDLGYLNGTPEANLAKAMNGSGLSGRVLDAVAAWKADNPDGTDAAQHSLNESEYLRMMEMEKEAQLAAAQRAKAEQEKREAESVKHSEEKTVFSIQEGALVGDVLYLKDRDGYLVELGPQGNVLNAQKGGAMAVGGNGAAAVIVNNMGVASLIGDAPDMSDYFEQIATDVSKVEMADDSMLFVIGDGLFSLDGDGTLNKKKDPDLILENGQAYMMRFGDSFAQGVIASKGAASGIIATASGDSALAFASDNGNVYVKMTNRNGSLSSVLGDAVCSGGKDRSENRVFAQVKAAPEGRKQHDPVALAVNDDALIVVEADGTAQFLGKVSSAEKNAAKKFAPVLVRENEALAGIAGAVLHDGYALFFCEDGSLWRLGDGQQYAESVYVVGNVAAMRRLDDTRTLLIDQSGRIQIMEYGLSARYDSFIEVRK